jgi:lanosterol synthase
MGDKNTDYSGPTPVNALMNFLVCYIKEGPNAYLVQRHQDCLVDYLWVKDEGMLVNGI